MVVMDTALMVDMDILMEAMVTEVCVNTAGRMAKDTEVDTEVTLATNSEAMVVTAVLNLEAMAVVMATLIPIIPQTKMNTSQKLEFLKSFFNHVFYSVISNIHIR